MGTHDRVNCTRGKGPPMHTHFSVLAAVSVFLPVLFIGTMWRLASLHLAASSNQRISQAGQAMAFQY